jgi:helicase
MERLYKKYGMKSISVNQHTDDPVVNVVLDTLDKNKQALVFVNTKRSAEKVAEDIARFLRKKKAEVKKELSENILHDLSKPTKQCEKLAEVIQHGIAFHHAGLTNKQKELIEDNFRNGNVKIICCTPTLAAGVDLPAFRTIIRDLKRFGVRGYTYIPVLEYLQMAGRAGRPRYDKEGESIVIVSTENEKEAVTEKYVNGEPEDITSKLAVEPVLRTHILSLIASNFVNSRKKLVEFFSKTFWAHQFEDMERLEKTIDRMLQLLVDFEFIKKKADDFASADVYLDEKIEATEIGRRVSQLYIDPLTAHEFIENTRRLGRQKPSIFGLLQMISNTPEIRPRLNVKAKEYDNYTALVVERESELLTKEPEVYDPEYEDFVDSIKTASFFMEWIEEKDDEYLLEKFDVRPGETRTKLDTADWLLYAAEELAKLVEFPIFSREVSKLRFRMRYGAKEELLPLLRLKEIGRVRARKLFNNDIKDLGDVKKADFMKLKQLLGEAVAKSIKEQVGEKVEEVKENKRKGQLSVNKF